MSTVTAKIEPAQRMASLLVEQLTAPVKFTQAARGLVEEGVKIFVEVGPGQRALRSREADRPDREDDLGQQRSPALQEGSRRPSLPPERFCSLEGQDGPRHRRLARHRAGDRASSSRGPGASVVVGYRSGAEEAEAVASEIGGRAVQADVSDPDEAQRLVEEAGDLDILVNNAGLTRDGAARADDATRTGAR